MTTLQSILLGRGALPQNLLLRYANRHGLIAGATGTGKTVTLQVLAEAFSRAGVPVFCADVKGDLSGLSRPGTPQPRIDERAAELGVADFAYEPAPVLFWDLFGEQGHPLRATVSEMGPLLLARLLELNDTQTGVLAIAFKLADDRGLLLLDFKDLTAMLQYLAEEAGEVTTAYGNVSKASIGAIQRRLLTLEQQGAEHFFGEPALVLEDLMLATPDGRGAVNVLMADRLIRSPGLYATFLLWLLSELFEELPEVGDVDKPKLVFFFDEAHLLFDDAPKALVEKVEQVVRLIRSKGVGVYFVTQNPADLPSDVLGQLGNRVQHALRAYTPAELKGIKAAAQSFRPNPEFDTAEVLTTLATGEALVSLLEDKGVPAVVQRTRILPPRSRMGTVTQEERGETRGHSPIGGKYDESLDRESAYELLQGRAETVAEKIEPGSPWGDASPPVRDETDAWGVEPGSARRIPPPRTRSRRVKAQPPPPKEPPSHLEQILFGTGRRQGVAEAIAKSVARSVGSQLGRSITRGILGSILKR